MLIEWALYYSITFAVFSSFPFCFFFFSNPFFYPLPKVRAVLKQWKADSLTSHAWPWARYSHWVVLPLPLKGPLREDFFLLLHHPLLLLQPHILYQPSPLLLLCCLYVHLYSLNTTLYSTHSHSSIIPTSTNLLNTLFSPAKWDKFLVIPSTALYSDSTLPSSNASKNK